MNKTLIFVLVVAAQVLLYFLICYPRNTGKVLLSGVGFLLTALVIGIFAGIFSYFMSCLWPRSQ